VGRRNLVLNLKWEPTEYADIERAQVDERTTVWRIAGHVIGVTVEGEEAGRTVYTATSIDHMAHVTAYSEAAFLPILIARFLAAAGIELVYTMDVVLIDEHNQPGMHGSISTALPLMYAPHESETTALLEYAVAQGLRELEIDAPNGYVWTVINVGLNVDSLLPDPAPANDDAIDDDLADVLTDILSKFDTK
jgi:hypothetical protein